MEGEHEHDVTVQSLKQKLVAVRNEQALERSARKVESTSCGCQTVPIDLLAKQQYDLAVQSIRGKCVYLL